MTALAAAGVVVTLALLRRAARATVREAGLTRLLPRGARPGRRAGGPASGLPDALDDVSRALRAGCSPLQAVEEAGRRAIGRPAAALREVVRAVARGAPLAGAASAWASQAATSDERLAAAAIALAAEGGATPARAVDGVAATLRERAALAAEVRANSAQARLSALVIGLLPVGFALWCVAADPRSAAFLLTTPPGWACVAAGLALEGLGVWWMARILRGVG